MLIICIFFFVKNSLGPLTEYTRPVTSMLADFAKNAKDSWAVGHVCRGSFSVTVGHLTDFDVEIGTIFHALEVGIGRMETEIGLPCSSVVFFTTKALIIGMETVSSIEGPMCVNMPHMMVRVFSKLSDPENHVATWHLQDGGYKHVRLRAMYAAFEPSKEALERNMRLLKTIVGVVPGSKTCEMYLKALTLFHMSAELDEKKYDDSPALRFVLGMASDKPLELELSALEKKFFKFKRISIGEHLLTLVADVRGFLEDQ